MVEVKAAKEFHTEKKINDHSIITQLNSFLFRLGYSKYSI